MSDSLPLVLVTGATGYVGGRLVSRLLLVGLRVRCLVRDPARLQGRSWLDHVEVVQADVLKPETLTPALEGVAAAYYLIHSMTGSEDFRRRDLELADNFGRAAKAAGVERIIYLGGLGNPEADLSQHLRSRQETGEALRRSGVPVTEFRAAMIVGSGSVSFELLRYLTERLPIIFAPSWIKTHIQPIGIRNVLEYLVAALMVPQSAGRIIEIGGPEVMTYADVIRGYAKARGLRRLFFPTPFLTPRFCAYWAHMVTPIPKRIARPLFEGLRNELIVRDDAAREIFPHIKPMDYQTTLKRAFQRLETGQVETAWSDALVTSKGDVEPLLLTHQEGMIIEQRHLIVDTTPEYVFQSFCGLGGKRGWLYFDWAWRVRGAMDRMIGGVGLRRGRRDPDELRVGDALDFWRVEAVKPDRLLRLRAEMKVPGEAWLQFQAKPYLGRTFLIQTAYFTPRGLPGLLYWDLLYPIHTQIFSGLIAKLAHRAERLAARANKERATNRSVPTSKPQKV